MHTADLLRDVRRRRGLSVREAATRCDVPRATWGDWEAGRAAPTTTRLLEALTALGFDLRLIARESEVDGEDAVRAHLRRSLTRRAALALGDQLGVVRRACQDEPRLLTGPAATGLWVPHVVARGPLPLPPAPDVPGMVAVRLPPHERLEAPAWAAVPPPSWQIDAGAHRTWPQLLTSARLLAQQAPRDQLGRQLPPHRDPDEGREARDLELALAWAGRGHIPISSTDSRAWRLDAPATLDEALRWAGLPVRNASRRRGPR